MREQGDRPDRSREAAATNGPGPAPGPAQDVGPPAGRGRFRNSRLVTVLLAASLLVGTALLVWGLDGAARWGADSLLARNIQTATGVAAPPTVRLHGTFFLPQVVKGRYDDVEITVRDLSTGPLRLRSVHADLRGVHLSFHDLLLRNIGPVHIDHATEQATMSYADLNHYLQATGRPVRIDAAPHGQVRLTGKITVLGHTISASTQAHLTARDNAVAVQPTQVVTGTPLDPASRLLIGQRFSFVVPMDPLPFGQQLTAIEATPSALHVHARGDGIVVRP
jgi:hypothetical protein